MILLVSLNFSPHISSSLLPPHLLLPSLFPPSTNLYLSEKFGCFLRPLLCLPGVQQTKSISQPLHKFLWTLWRGPEQRHVRMICWMESLLFSLSSSSDGVSLSSSSTRGENVQAGQGMGDIPQTLDASTLHLNPFTGPCVYTPPSRSSCQLSLLSTLFKDSITITISSLPHSLSDDTKSLSPTFSSSVSLTYLNWTRPLATSTNGGRGYLRGSLIRMT